MMDMASLDRFARATVSSAVPLIPYPSFGSIYMLAVNTPDGLTSPVM